MSVAIKPEAAPYLEAFRTQEGNATEPDWLLDRRAAALKHFAALGFPTRREEPWRFTNWTAPRCSLTSSRRPERLAAPARASSPSPCRGIWSQSSRPP